MKKYYVYCLLLVSMLGSCKKEAELKPSNTDSNFYTISDNPADVAQHALYQFYAATGIAVFTKDTIGKQTRADAFGLPLVHYEVLQVDYNPDGKTVSYTAGSTYYINLTNKSDAVFAVKFLTDNIIAALPKGVVPSNFLLTDTLNSKAYGTDAFKGYNTVVLGSVPNLHTFDAERINAYKAAVLRAIVSSYVLDSQYTNTLTANFYGVSRAFIATGQDDYGLSVYNILSFQGQYSTSLTPLAYLQSIGFLNSDPTIPLYGSDPNIYNVQSPPTYLDVSQYIEAIFTYNTAQFTAIYGNSAAIMKKYAAMKNILTNLGFTLN